MSKIDTIFNSTFNSYNVDNTGYEELMRIKFLFSDFYRYFKYFFDYKSTSDLSIKFEFYNSSSTLVHTITDTYDDSTTITSTGVVSEDVLDKLTTGVYELVVSVYGSGVEIKNLNLILE